MQEHPGAEDRSLDESFRDELESMRLVDLDGTLRGAPGRIDRPIRIEFDFLGVLLFNLMRAIVFGVLPGTAMMAATVGAWVMTAVPGLRQARRDTLSAEADYHQELRHTQPVLTELAALGAPSESLETVYFAFADARGDEARTAADRYLGLLSDQIDLVEDPTGERTGEAARLLGPASSARAKTSAAYLDWQARTHTANGRVAVWLRLVPEPTGAMAIYDRPHPRS